MVRKDGKLPRRVYLKHGAYYYVTAPERKWIRLGKTESEMYAALSKLFNKGSEAGKLSEFLTRYRKEVIPTKAPRTQKDNETEIQNLGKAFGDMHPGNIKPKHIYAYMDARGKTSKTRANREKSLLSNIFSYLVRWGVVEHNPCKEVKNFSEPQRNRYVKDFEYQAVFDMASLVMKAAMEIAVTTGLRQGDILSLKYNQITPEGLEITTSKTGKKLVFSMTPALLNAIELSKRHSRHATSAIYIICNEQGQKYTSSGFKSNWQRLIKKAVKETGVEHFRFADLRPKAASEHAQGDRLLGHQDPKTTRKHYERKPTKVKPIR